MVVPGRRGPTFGFALLVIAWGIQAIVTQSILLREALVLMGEGKVNPSVMITHVGGLDSAADTILTLPEIAGGKKLIYTQVAMPLTAIADFAEQGEEDPFFAALAEICDRHNGLWSTEAEQYLLANAKPLSL